MIILHKRAIWLILFVVIVVAMISVKLGASRLNHYQVSGEISVFGLSNPVTIYRDKWGIPYILAESDRDLWFAQGFVTAQHRLFQMESYRRLLKGELAEAIGEAGLESDRYMRTLNIPELARQHAGRLPTSTKDMLQAYAEGINAYRDRMKHELPLEFELTDMMGNYWTIDDIMTVVYLVSLTHSVNAETELLAQRIIEKVGARDAEAFLALNFNPDRTEQPGIPVQTFEALELAELEILRKPELPKFGSNNWVISGDKSVSGAPIVANDPHLDSRILPGIWHPIGLFSPNTKAGGLSVPGLPGIFSGRTGPVAFGVTNAYGDVQDLYVEELHPEDLGRFKQGSGWQEFRQRAEIIRIKDADQPSGFREEEIIIRSTPRGPVVSDFSQSLQISDHVITLRWAPATIEPEMIGLDQMMRAQSCDEIENAIANMAVMQFNWAYADEGGCIGRRASGSIPIREFASGALPQSGAMGHSWMGSIPASDMPGEKNPARGWTGTANHDVRPDGYPYSYSSFFSPSYRYQRLSALMDTDKKLDADDMLRFMRDTGNMQAEAIVPIILDAISPEKELNHVSNILKNWDHRDAIESQGSVLYHTIMRHLPKLIVADELGPELTDEYLDQRYVWLERFEAWMNGDAPAIIENKETPATENQDAIIREAVSNAVTDLQNRFGSSWSSKTWGETHSVTFVSGLKQEGAGSKLFGAGTHPVEGSGETLARSNYAFAPGENAFFETTFFVSGRTIIDLAQTDAIRIAVAGGVTDRVLRPERDNLIKPWIAGEMIPLWTSAEAAAQNAVSTTMLVPAQ